VPLCLCGHPFFKKVLIANRGEIAVRIERGLRELGVASAAVYSDADRDSLHVRLADEAYRLGPAPSSLSYLRVDKILEAAERSGAEAVHPGYGFLAENADFARACADAGLVFIGPPPEAVHLMGDKVEARAVAERAGVPTVPGTGALTSVDDAIEKAPGVGFPLLVKATAGGGGKGMRQVSTLEELSSAFEQASSEAQSSFSNPSVFLEKFIERPRHIEFQVVADQNGNTVHLLERECSVQRRHQKLIEEAPSPFVDDALRRRMGDAAVAVAREAGYVNAGTVEFLPFEQSDIVARGWAMEFRVTAEDPFQNFIPSAGRIRFLRAAEGPGIRNDSGVYAGFEVTPHYDPLIAKLVVAGDDRMHCLSRARRAVREYQVDGIATTLPFFARMLADERFIAGDIDVSFVDRHWMSEIAVRPSERRSELLTVALAAAAAEDGSRRTTRRGLTAKASAWKQMGLREQVGNRL